MHNCTFDGWDSQRYQSLIRSVWSDQTGGQLNDGSRCKGGQLSSNSFRNFEKFSWKFEKFEKFNNIFSRVVMRNFVIILLQQCFEKQSTVFYTKCPTMLCNKEVKKWNSNKYLIFHSQMVLFLVLSEDSKYICLFLAI